jgi:hypothetical protein
MQIEIKLASESHVPRFRAGVGTWRSGYMIPIRLPWRHRARPSATLHEIPLAPKGKVVFTMLHSRQGFVKSKLFGRQCPLQQLGNFRCHLCHVDLARPILA